MKAWRIEKNKRLAPAWIGEGARIAGGRWNSPGLPAVYLSEHLSLALLEILMHSPDSNQRKAARGQAMVDIPERLVETLALDARPPGFGPNASIALTRDLGDSISKHLPVGTHASLDHAGRCDPR